MFQYSVEVPNNLLQVFKPTICNKLDDNKLRTGDFYACVDYGVLYILSCVFCFLRNTLRIGLVWGRLENEMQFIPIPLKISLIHPGMDLKLLLTKQLSRG